MSERKKKYQTNNRFNPVLQAHKITKLSNTIENLGKTLEALSKSNDNHIAYLGNFARHDIKNAIQSMDSILSTTESNEFDEEKINSLTVHLEVIRITIDNFVKLVPYSDNGRFKIDSLFTAVELLNRSDIQHKKIDFKLNFKRGTDFEINLPFQSLLQLLNNLVINSLKSLEEEKDKRLFIEGDISSESFQIRIRDNGKKIEVENQSKVFEYGYSTTGGSGIGLYHAKYLCELFKGDITLEINTEGEFNKTFFVNLPTNIKDGEDNFDNR